MIRSLPLFLVSIMPGCGGVVAEESSESSLEDPYSLLRDVAERAIRIIQGGERVMRPQDPLVIRAGTPGMESVLCKWPQDQSGRSLPQGSSAGLNGYCAIRELEGGKVIRKGRIGLGEDAGMWGITTGMMLPKGIRGFVGWSSPDAADILGPDHWNDIGIEWFIQPGERKGEGECEISRENDLDPPTVSRELPQKTIGDCYSWQQDAYASLLKIIGAGLEKPLARCMVCEQETCTSTQTADDEVCKTTNPPEYFR